MAKIGTGPLKQLIGPANHRLIGYINDGKNQIQALKTDSPPDLNQLKATWKKLEKTIGQLENYNEQWAELAIKAKTQEETSAIEADYSKFIEENKFPSAIDSGRKYMVELEILIDQMDEKENKENANSTKLPQLVLPTFSGKPTEWGPFWSQFESAVDKRKNIRDVDKFNYLKSTLTGRALEEIAGYPASDQSYKIVIEQLKKRFGDKNTIISNLYSELRQLPPSGNAIPNIRKSLTEMERILRLLQNLGEDTNSHAMLIIAESKLPQWLLLKLLELKERDNNWNLSKLREHTDKIISLRETAFLIAKDHENANRPNRSNRLNQPQKGNFSRYNNQSQRNYYNRGYPSNFPLNKVNFQNRSRFNPSNTNEPERHVFVVNQNDQRRNGTTNYDHQQMRNIQKAQNMNNFVPKTNFSGGNNQKSGYSCTFCYSKEHNSGKCEKYKGYENRTKRLRELKRCEKCLGSNHSTNNCIRKIKCKNCNGLGHYALVCPKNRNMTVNLVNAEEEQTEHVVSALENDIKKVYLMALRAEIRNPITGKTLEKLIFFDPGATNRFITEDCVESLGIERKNKQKLTIYGFNPENNGKGDLTFDSHKVEFGIKMANGKMVNYRANTVPSITRPINVIMLSNTHEILPDIVGTERKVPDILLSVNYFWELFDSFRKLNSGLKLINTKIGPLICGRQAFKYVKPPVLHNVSKEEYVMAFETEGKPNHDKLSDNYWDLETIGIRDSPYATIKDEDNEAVAQFNNTIQRLENGRYEVGWPWKNEGQKSLPFNYNMAFHRLRSTLNKWSNNAEIMKKYDDVIKEQLENDIIEEAPANDNGIIHYLPHQAVFKESSAHTKIRIVYDASAKVKGNESLNEQLLRGPNLLPNLAGVLLRARFPKILQISDIAKAFLTIQLREEDRDVTRFIWIKDPNKPLSPENKVVYRFKRVLFGVSSPFLLIKTIHHHLDLSWKSPNGKFPPMLCSEIKRSLYMDNIITGAENEEECIEKYDMIKQLFSNAQMNVREFLSNSKRVNETYREEDKYPGDGKIKLLGVGWDTDSDRFEIKFPKIEFKTEIPNKRDVLALIHSVFDPLGLASPALLHAKLFFQNLCKENYQWNQKLTEEKYERWKELMEDWKEVKIEFNRYIPYDWDYTYQIHTFVDASEVAFSASVYLRIDKGEGNVSCELLFAKNRLAPLKRKKKEGEQKVSIPRLELLAILIGVRATKFVCEEISGIPLERIVIWSDSQINLHRINSNILKERDRFVKNRLMEIKLHRGYEFRWCETSVNPADISTRGIKATDLYDNRMWWNGPEWLIFDEFEGNGWPKEIIIYLEETEEDLEESNERETNLEKTENLENNQDDDEDEIYVHVMVASRKKNKKLSKSEDKGQPTIIDINRFSSWWKLLFTMIYILRFIKIKVSLRKDGKINSHKLIKNLSTTGPFTPTDIRIGKYLLIRFAQKGIPPTKDEWMKYKIFENRRILRCASRLQNMRDNYDFANPIYLPQKHRITELIILEYHIAHLHCGVQHLLAQLRQRYFIPHAISTIKSVIKGCLRCRKYKSQPYALPEMPSHPKSRIEKYGIFSNIGLDYLGPLTVKYEGMHKKCWILLINCLNTRAIHLESIIDMTAETFLRGMRRFIARRGKPDSILSDNGSQFVLSDKVLTILWNSLISNSEISTYFAKEGIQWKFISASSPFKGGIYERLVQNVKNAFRRSVGRKMLNLDEFNTFVTETESIINCRPIAPIQNELNDISILRPIDFIMPYRETGTPSHLPDNETDTTWMGEETNSAEKLVEKWHENMKKLDEFWQLWYTDYLSSLRERDMVAKHKQPRSKNTQKPTVGEIVLINDDILPRGCWKMGKIIKVEDRMVELKLANGRKITRPYSLIHSLEVPKTLSENIIVQEQQPKINAESENPTENYLLPPEDRLPEINRRKRPQRQAARTAMQTVQRLKSSLLVLLLILEITLGVSGTPMICPNSEAVTYFRIDEREIPCANFTEDNPIPTQHSFNLYRPNTQLIEINSAHCTIIEETIEYRTDLINNRHSIRYKRILPVTFEECKSMVVERKCSFGILDGKPNCTWCEIENGKTENNPSVEFSYWKFGPRNATVTNCYVTPHKIYLRPGSKQLLSPLADVSKCEFFRDYCSLTDNSVIIWNSEIFEDDDRICEWKGFGFWKGNFMGKTWISDNNQFAISFSKNPEYYEDRKQYECHRDFAISDQGIAVPLIQYILLINKHHSRMRRSVNLGNDTMETEEWFEERGLTRTNWSEIMTEINNSEMERERKNGTLNSVEGDGAVHSPQLAAQLTALDLLNTDVTRRAFNHLAGLICSKYRNLFDFGHNGLEATRLARYILKTPFVRAKWVNKEVLELKKCMPIPIENITFIPTLKCYKMPKIKAKIGNFDMEAFIDPELRTIESEAGEGECHNDRTFVFEWDGQLIRVEQKTGSISKIGNDQLHNITLGMGAEWTLPNITNHIFLNFVLENYSDPKQEVIQMFRAFDMSRKFKKSDVKLINRGEWRNVIHETKEEFLKLIPFYNWDFLSNITIWNAWVFFCCLYITLMLIIKHIIPFLIAYVLQYVNWGRVWNTPRVPFKSSKQKNNNSHLKCHGTSTGDGKRVRSIIGLQIPNITEFIEIPLRSEKSNKISSNESEKSVVKSWQKAKTVTDKNFTLSHHRIPLKKNFFC